VNSSAWNSNNKHTLQSSIRTMDFSTIDDSLRGFSDAVRVGRYAYLTPLNSADFVFSCSMIRIDLGIKDIGTTIDETLSATGNIRNIVAILSLAKVDSRLCGFSGLFNAGQYLILVPYRNTYEPRNGQRGHGLLVRLNMNDYSTSGIEFADLTTTQRSQIPSFADTNLRGFSYGFPCEWLFFFFFFFSCSSNFRTYFSISKAGQYGLLVPFYNADFNGKVARFLGVGSLDKNLQELDLMVDRQRPRVYKGYRGGFVSIWQGVAY
jgi:hypothetical protein